MPVTRSAQYILFWYIAETLPRDLEGSLTHATATGHGAYQIPNPFPRDMSVKERIALDKEEYEPVKHQNTGVDEEEALYESYLLSVGDAVEKLRGTVMADVVGKGWEGICARMAMEEEKGVNGL